MVGFDTEYFGVQNGLVHHHMLEDSNAPEKKVLQHDIPMEEELRDKLVFEQFDGHAHEELAETMNHEIEMDMEQNETLGREAFDSRNVVGRYPLDNWPT